MKIFNLLIFFIISFSANALCIDGKIKFGKAESNERYCFDDVLKTIVSAKKCPGNLECITNLEGPFKLKAKTKETACLEMKGDVQVIEYWNKEKWIKTSRCLFSDGSYSDLNTQYLKVIK